MSKQDVNAVRTAQDLEIKYDLSSIAGLKKNYEIQKQGLTKVENELNDFVKVTTQDIEEIKNQVDGNVTTWFSSGIPTLENYPASEWPNETEKSNHLGDLYYDQDTGYAYRFIQKDGIFSWLRITDSDVTEALAIANAAKDTADRKRQIFVVQPKPPYDVGDLWIRDEEIYCCQTSRPEGETFEDNDWIKATKYTDDTVANQVDGKITILSGTVTEIKQNVDELKTTMTNTTKVVDEHDNTIGILQEKQSETSQTVDNITTRVSTVENDLVNTNLDLSNLSDIVDKNKTDIGTIKTNVSELQQTDEQIKASVESIDKQIIPTATATGSNIYVDDASDDPLIQLEIEGKSEQKTKTSKNKANITTFQKGYIHSKGYLVNDYSKGEMSSDFIEVKPNTTYTFSIIETTNNYESWFGVAQYTSNVAISEDYFIRRDTNTDVTATSITFTTTSDAKYVIVCSRNLIGATKVQFEEGIATEYEPYGVSPGPYYPSEIESVGYNNIWDEQWELGNINNDTGALENNSEYIRTKNYINISSLSTYYRTPSIDSTRIFFYDENYNYLSNYTVQLNGGTFTTPNNAKYIKFKQYGKTYNNDIAIFKGAEIHDYISYGKYVVEIETIGKNLCYSSVPNGNNASLYVYAKSIKSKTLTISLIPDISYINNTIYGYIVGVEGLGGLGTITCDANTKGNVTITLSDSVYSSIQKGNIVEFRIYKGDGTVSSIKEAQVELGNNATDYELYQSNTSLIVLNQPLRSLSNGVKDLAYIKKNKLYVERKVGSLVLNGSQGVSLYTFSGMNGVSIGNALPVNMARASGMCSHSLKVGAYYSSNSIWCGVDSKNIYWIGILDLLGLSTADEFKTWLLTNNTQIDYELATPIIEEIDEIEMSSTLKGYNNIFVNDDLEPTLNIEYVRDTILSNYVEGQVNNLKTIEERHYSELVVEDDLIKESVTETNRNLIDMTGDIHTVQETLTSQEKTLEVISTNIDKTTGEIREVTTINGYKFNKDGLNIYTNENSFNTLIDNEGTYYKDGNTIISETTKDGFMATSIKNKGGEEYCYDKTNEVYEFVKERVEVDGEYGYATFYNGVN